MQRADGGSLSSGVSAPMSPPCSGSAGSIAPRAAHKAGRMSPRFGASSYTKVNFSKQLCGGKDTAHQGLVIHRWAGWLPWHGCHRPTMAAREGTLAVGLPLT